MTGTGAGMRVLLSGLGLCLVVSALVFAGGYFAREDVRAGFAPKVEAWSKLALPPAEGEPGPYLRGRLVLIEAAVLDYKPTWGVVETQPARLDAAQFELPSHLQASSPEEVAMVVICAHKRVPLEIEYRVEGAAPGTGIRAFRHDVQVRLFDLQEGVCAGQLTLKGAEPKEELGIGESSEGEPPDLQAWLASLPWRPAR